MAHIFHGKFYKCSQVITLRAFCYAVSHLLFKPGLFMSTQSKPQWVQTISWTAFSQNISPILILSWYGNLKKCLVEMKVHTAHTVPFVESNQISEKLTFQYLLIVLRSVEHNEQLVIGGSDVILRQTVNIKMLLLL